MAFEKATKKQARLRLAVFGPSGSGKTMTALRLATGIGGRIALIDTENNSASKYADRFSFDRDNLRDKTIDGYLQSIQDAAKAGYEVLIIDSLSHGWQELLQEVERLARAKYRGNSWAAWSEGTPKQKRLIDAIVNYPGHLIATIRSKTEWAKAEEGEKGKPTRIGLAPEQGKGIEYEFDLLMELTADHLATVIKDRSDKFQDRMIEKPGEDLGHELAEWLSEGEPEGPIDELRRLCARLGYTDEHLLRWLIKKFSLSIDLRLAEALAELEPDEVSQAIDTLRIKLEEKGKAA